MCATKIITFYTVAARVLCLINADCNVVKKQDWGGLDPVRVSYLVRPVDLVIIQHTVTPRCTTDTGCAERVRNIQDYHIDELNYWDVGHSFLVGGNAKVYEGTGWLHVGAHTRGYNARSIGIAFIGNYNNDEPSADQLNAVKDLLKCGVENGHLTANYHVVGHKQLIATQSPGRRLYQKIRAWPEWLEDASSLKNRKLSR